MIENSKLKQSVWSGLSRVEKGLEVWFCNKTPHKAWKEGETKRTCALPRKLCRRKWGRLVRCDATQSNVIRFDGEQSLTDVAWSIIGFLAA